MNTAQLRALRVLALREGFVIRRNNQGKFEVWEGRRCHGEMNSYEGALELVSVLTS